MYKMMNINEAEILLKYNSEIKLSFARDLQNGIFNNRDKLLELRLQTDFSPFLKQSYFKGTKCNSLKKDC